MQHPAELPGEEFLQRRLSRAAAIPLEQRSPEVAAFVAAMLLPQQVATLLPLQVDGTAALALRGAEAGRRTALAVLMMLQAKHASPYQLPAIQHACKPHCAAYSDALCLLAGVDADHGGTSAASARMGNVSDEAWLARWLFGTLASRQQAERGQHMAALQGFSHTRELLVGIGARAERCLHQLVQLQRNLLPEAAPLPTVPQLLGICRSLALEIIEPGWIDASREALSGAARQGLLVQADAAAAELLSLEPDSPKAHWLIAQALASLEQHQRCIDYLLRCFQLARQRGSDYYSAAALLLALPVAGPQLSPCRPARPLAPAPR
ncbi:hypothetical protein ABPG75_009971 [Micractinium tetrahymenae]